MVERRKSRAHRETMNVAKVVGIFVACLSLWAGLIELEMVRMPWVLPSQIEALEEEFEAKLKEEVEKLELLAKEARGRHGDMWKDHQKIRDEMWRHRR